MTDSTCADFGEPGDTSHFSTYLSIGLDHQAVLDENSQTALNPSLYLETESLESNSCSGQHHQTMPRDPSALSLFNDDIDIGGDYEDGEENVCPCASKDSSRKGFILRELLDE